MYNTWPAGGVDHQPGPYMYIYTQIIICYYYIIILAYYIYIISINMACSALARLHRRGASIAAAGGAAAGIRLQHSSRADHLQVAVMPRNDLRRIEAYSIDASIDAIG